MEQVAVQDDDELLAGFNEVLGQHMERLLGFRLGPAGMPLTVTTLACLALLSDRKDDDLEGVNAGTGYTAEGLLAELSDLGLREYGECEDILRQLTEKGYVRPVREGGVMPNPVTLRLEELLERIFPKMPGLNFVAYATQTMGEVKTGRKDLSLALRQFDQTLTMQGHALVRRGPATMRLPSRKRRLWNRTKRKVSSSRYGDLERSFFSGAPCVITIAWRRAPRQQAGPIISV